MLGGCAASCPVSCPRLSYICDPLCGSGSGQALVGRKAFQEQESKISKAEYLCNQVLELMHKDILSFDHVDSVGGAWGPGLER